MITLTLQNNIEIIHPHLGNSGSKVKYLLDVSIVYTDLGMSIIVIFCLAKYNNLSFIYIYTYICIEWKSFRQLYDKCLTAKKKEFIYSMCLFLVVFRSHSIVIIL